MVWIVSLFGIVPVSVFGSDAVQRQVCDIYFVRTLGLLGAGFAIIHRRASRVLSLVAQDLAQRAVAPQHAQSDGRCRNRVLKVKGGRGIVIR